MHDDSSRQTTAVNTVDERCGVDATRWGRAAAANGERSGACRLIQLVPRLISIDVILRHESMNQARRARTPGRPGIARPSTGRGKPMPPTRPLERIDAN